MSIIRNKHILTVFSVIMLTGGITFSVLGYNTRQAIPVKKFCRSEYSMTMHSTRDPISSEGTFYMFSESGDKLVLNVSGRLTTEKGSYNISRRLYFKLTRSQRGSIKEIQSAFIRSDKYPADNAPDAQVDQRLFGTLETNGSRYRVEQLKPDTLVIGSYFSPFYLCQFER